MHDADCPTPGAFETAVDALATWKIERRSYVVVLEMLAAEDYGRLTIILGARLPPS